MTILDFATALNSATNELLNIKRELSFCEQTIIAIDSPKTELERLTNSVSLRVHYSGTHRYLIDTILQLNNDQIKGLLIPHMDKLKLKIADQTKEVERLEKKLMDSVVDNKKKYLY